MDETTWMTFPALTGTAHRFVLREPRLDMNVEREEALSRLAPWHEDHSRALGFQPEQLRLAEQVHGCQVARVNRQSPRLTLNADGLITDDATVVLGIYVADCAAVFLADRQTGALGLIHSGRKGTELGIVPAAIHQMRDSLGSDPADIVVQISPCIRPPAYEVDFAATLREQCLAAGICAAHLHDCGLCTATDLRRFYSYRLEKGRTGRMLALLGRLPGC